MKKLTVLIFLFHIITFAQNKSNFDVIDSLIVSEANELKTPVSLVFPESLKILKNRLRAQHNNLFVESSQSQLSVDNISIVYDNPFRYWFLGGLHYIRNIKLSGTVTGNNLNATFTKTFKDTVANDDIDEIENKLLSFTAGEIKEDNSLTILSEPVIALTAAVISVILLFVVRGN